MGGGELMALLGGAEWSAFSAVPTYRRIQTVSIAVWTSFIFTSAVLNVFCVLCLRWTWWWYLPYLTYCIFDNAPHELGRPSKYFKNLTFFKTCASYFPLTLIKDKPEEKWNHDKPHLFGFHPHGILALGIILAFGTEAVNISRVIPGLRICNATLNFCVKFPFMRELTMRMGAISCNLNTLDGVMNRGGGHGVAVVVGGAEEAKLSKPKNYQLVLRKRKGFFRLALKHGAYLVPVYCFGENDVYEPWEALESPLVAFVSKVFIRGLGFSVPVFQGRGLMQYTRGFIPRRRRITVVLGSPISTTRVENPTDQQIDELQAKYCKELVDLFDRRKGELLLDGSDAELKFVA